MPTNHEEEAEAAWEPSGTRAPGDPGGARAAESRPVRTRPEARGFHSDFKKLDGISPPRTSEGNSGKSSHLPGNPANKYGGPRTNVLAE